ncbi:MAG: CHAD domain-containing protein [Solirubrobacterales bacterium]|nr:CHAD domain-containing protein [Solirubrobacterales bacterium]
METRHYLLPSVEALESAEGLRLERVIQHSGDAVLYDTFDGKLWDAGALLMHALGELRVVGSELRAPFSQAPDAISAADLPSGPLKARLEPLLGVRSALAQVRISGNAANYKLLDELDKTIARVEVQDAAVGSADLGVRAHVWPLRGYEEETDALFAGRFQACSEGIYAEAMAAVGRDPHGIRSKVRVGLSGHEWADGGVARVLRALWDVIDANREGTLEDTDIEFLHDYRVCVRKSRAVLKELRGVFTPAARAHWRAEFRWLQQVTGATRDLDVYLEDFDELAGLVPAQDRAALEPLRTVLANRRVAAREAMVTELRSRRAVALGHEWPLYLARLTEEPVAERPDASAKIDTVAFTRIRKLYSKMVKMGQAIMEGEPHTPAEDYHELRKQGKELRYLVELFGEPLGDAEIVKPMVRTLKGLQDVLGRHQDREVQGAFVRELVDDVAAVEGSAPALLAMGSLIGALERDEVAARAEFGAAFTRFSSEEQRTLVKEAFGK